jgi:hypothetical protein
MSKYEPLTAFLISAGNSQLRLSFSEIEKVLGFKLPASKSYQAWWSNNPSNNVMTKAWLAAGYKTEQVDLDNEKVTFVQSEGKQPLPPAADLTERVVPRSPLFGSMKGTTIIMPGVDLTAPADPDWGKVYDDDYQDGISYGAVGADVEKVTSNTSLNVSEKIRALDSLGLPRAQIAKVLGKRYQHVRNVLTAVRKAG